MNNVVCQICGHPITGRTYHWDDDPRLPMHKEMTGCMKAGSPDVNQAFADFMNRNIEFINRRGEPVLLEA